MSSPPSHLWKLHGRTLLLLLASLVLGVGCKKAKPAAKVDDAGPTLPSQEEAFPSKAELLRQIKARVEEKRAVGVVLAVRRADGSHTIVEYGNAGAAALPLSSKSVFEIGSITKVFTGILLAEMEARGELGEQDLAQDYAHEGVKIPRFGDKPIRLVDLATHMSGLPRMPSNMAPADPSNPYADYSEDQLHNFLNALTLTRGVGETHEYSNLGTGLLGHLLAAIHKSSWEELVQERITAPLGMNMTSVTLTGEMKRQLALGHDASGKAVNNWDLPTFAGAGALRSNAEDMLKFLEANLATEDSQLSAAMRASHRPRADTGPKTKIGLNWFHQQTNKHTLIWHNGATGGYHSFIGFDPKRKVGVVILANSTHSLDDLGMHLLDNDLPLVEAPKERVEIEVPEKLLADYVGVYQLSPNFYIQVTLADGALYTQASGQQKVPVFAESQTEFFLKITDAQLTFSRNDQGKVAKLVLHQGGGQHSAPRLEGTAATEAIESILGKKREEVKIKASLLADYVGVYALTPSFQIEVTQANGGLMIQATNQPASPVFAESETKFFSKVVDAQLSFVRDSSGEVTELILHQGGMNQTAKKTK